MILLDLNSGPPAVNAQRSSEQSLWSHVSPRPPDPGERQPLWMPCQDTGCLQGPQSLPPAVSGRAHLHR